MADRSSHRTEIKRIFYSGCDRPPFYSPKEVYVIIDIFEGERNIYEKEAGVRFLVIKRMYKKNYVECALHLKKEGSEDIEKE